MCIECREEAAKKPCPRIDRWSGYDVAWTSLQNCDFERFLCEVWEKGYCCGAAADDNNLLARPIEIFRPELRVNLCAFKVVNPGNICLQWHLIIVISSPKDQESPSQMSFLITSIHRQ